MITVNDILKISTHEDFSSAALQVFKFQSERNEIYSNFLKHLKIHREDIHSINEIPFMPISFFKDFKILSGTSSYEKIFTSSGTTGSQTSRHYVHQLEHYHQQLDKSFERFFGDYTRYEIFSLLPAYAERTGSSLIDMVEHWKTQSGQTHQKHYLYNHEELFKDLQLAMQGGKKIILIGVTFALLAFAKNFPFPMKNTILIETGGMKGRKEEITRGELHSILKEAFQLDKVYSEYGMTELLSQAYALGGETFSCPPWMRILLRDTQDPLSTARENKTGGINIIDLANLYSCSFIATDDLGKLHQNGSFELLGRFDNSDIRGCNLLVAKGD